MLMWWGGSVAMSSAVILFTYQPRASQRQGGRARRSDRRDPCCIGVAAIEISAAHGVYSFSGGDDGRRMIEAADREMYSRKRAPRA